jgi:hypothetical protein
VCVCVCVGATSDENWSESQVAGSHAYTRTEDPVLIKYNINIYYIYESRANDGVYANPSASDARRPDFFFASSAPHEGILIYQYIMYI